MKIGCLGWGSLVWEPRSLPVQRCWFYDGPFLPIEFARQSRGGRITLVLTPGTALIRSLWTLMRVTDLDMAKASLAEREEISEKYISKYVGYWSQAKKYDSASTGFIEKWASHIGIDAVVWTALPPKFANESGRVPTIVDVVSFLRTLPQVKQRNAEEYIRKTPRQIDTEYRRQIEAELNWTPVGAI